MDCHEDVFVVFPNKVQLLTSFDGEFPDEKRELKVALGIILCIMYDMKSFNA